jgi:CheY-like chemotaxis protein
LSAFTEDQQMQARPILLVEDDENDVFLFQRAAKKAGIAGPVHVVRDGREAIDFLQGASQFTDRRESPLPGLVLLDLKLPFVMGLDVLKWIRQESGLTPIVVILSSSQANEDIAAAYRLGANGYLVKPAGVSTLEDMLKAINDFWLKQNVFPRDSWKPSAKRTTQGRPHAEGEIPHGQLHNTTARLLGLSSANESD